MRKRRTLLAAAGFSFRPANTPERAAALRKLPPHKFVYQTRNGNVVWIYADPTICGCLYVGDQQAFDRYRQEVFQKRIADEREMAAQMNQEAAWDPVRWAAWGPWAPYILLIPKAAQSEATK